MLDEIQNNALTDDANVLSSADAERKLSWDVRYRLFSAIAKNTSQLLVQERGTGNEQTTRSFIFVADEIIKQADVCLGEKGEGNLENFSIVRLCYADDPGPADDNIPLVKGVLRHFTDSSVPSYDIPITQEDRTQYTDGDDTLAQVLEKKVIPTNLPQLVFIQKKIQ